MDTLTSTKGATMNTTKMQTNAGEHITHAAERAIRMAVERGAIVEFDSNDVRCEASSGESADDVVGRWHAENERRAALRALALAVCP